jgi:TatD DNase family protein
MNQTSYLVDTHAHLDDGQFPDVDATIDAAVRQSVTKIINIGYGPERWESTIALAKRRPEIAVVLGIHPLDADQFSPAVFNELIAIIDQVNPVGIGEAGVDLFRDGPSIDRQRDAFMAQIELALARNLPLVIHQRSAETDVLELLRAADPALRVVLHSFDGSAESIDLVIERGWFIGVGGLMTRPSSSGLRELIRMVPLSAIVLETDSPYLAPAGVKNRRNNPGNIPIIARALADVRRASYEEIVRTTTENAIRAFPGLFATHDAT